jgi:hypothetical protein
VARFFAARRRHYDHTVVEHELRMHDNAFRLAGYDEMLLEAECFAKPLDGRSQESRPDVCSSATTALRF